MAIETSLISIALDDCGPLSISAEEWKEGLLGKIIVTRGTWMLGAICLLLCSSLGRRLVKVDNPAH